MLELLLESALRTAAVALAVWVVLKLAKIHAAPVQHVMWTAVLMMMLATPVILSWGPEASIPVLPSASFIPPDVTIADEQPVSERTEEADSAPASTPAAPPAAWDSVFYLSGIYLSGLLVLLGRLTIGSWQVRRLVRGAVLKDGMLAHRACSTPITVGWFRPKVILPEDWESWPQEKQDAVLAHEREHVRRRDPLIQRLALVNRAVFWFHPLAWWLERKIGALAEQACDEAVLELGHDPHSYSEYLIEMAHSVKRHGSRVQLVGMAMPGLGLGERIRQILSGRHQARTSRLRLVSAVAVCSVFAMGLTTGRLVRAQQRQEQSAVQDRPSFEVATIKPGGPVAPGLGGAGIFIDQNRFRASNITLEGLIRYAYGQGFGLDLEITGGPDWMSKDRFDIVGQAEEDSVTQEQLRQMVQSLLAERFAAEIQYATKEGDVFALLRSREDGELGPNITDACEEFQPSWAKQNAKDDATAEDKPDLPQCGINIGPYNSRSLNGTMEQLARSLSIPGFQLGRPVVDRTGLTGQYKVDLIGDFARGLQVEAENDFKEVGPSIFDALQEQVGLKLEPAKGSIPYVVVDHVEPPTEN